MGGLFTEKIEIRKLVLTTKWGEPRGSGTILSDPDVAKGEGIQVWVSNLLCDFWV